MNHGSYTKNQTLPLRDRAADLPERAAGLRIAPPVAGIARPAYGVRRRPRAPRRRPRDRVRHPQEWYAGPRQCDPRRAQCAGDREERAAGHTACAARPAHRDFDPAHREFRPTIRIWFHRVSVIIGHRPHGGTAAPHTARIVRAGEGARIAMQVHERRALHSRDHAQRTGECKAWHARCICSLAIAAQAIARSPSATEVVLYRADGAPAAAGAGEDV